ncbi:MAG: 4'-phosphopantetheinyl transferase superfamily protein [Planctomycetales bacterium]|nr:4'-phosphopantetheinyl transferase superfamily protein [Planctomycetales bacterium]
MSEMRDRPSDQPYRLDARQADVRHLPPALPLALIDRLATLLSDDERRRAAGFQAMALRQRFITMHGALRLLLSAYTECPADQLEFRLGVWGKPELVENPSNLRFSVTYAATGGAIAITRQASVGVDVEMTQWSDDWPALARRCFAPHELRGLESYLRAGDRTNAARMFARTWAGKEAVLKAIGLGLVDGLAGLETPEEGRGLMTMGAAPIELTEDLACRAEWCKEWWLEPLHCDSRSVGAIAVPGSDWKVVERVLDPRELVDLCDSRLAAC